MEVMITQAAKKTSALSRLELPWRCPSSPRARLSAVGYGFTLTEMLVAIAVIIIIAAISISGGKSALQSARTAEAMSNLKETGAIVANYAAENNNRLPLSADWRSGYVFQNILSDYFPELRNTPYNSSARLYLSRIFYDPVLKGKNEHPYGSFGVNSAVILDSNRYSEGNAQGVGMPLSMIPSTSQKVIVCSAIEPNYASSWGTDGDVFVRNGYDPTYGPDPRYGGMAGALFLDGHVEKLDVKNMDQAKRRRYFTREP